MGPHKAAVGSKAMLFQFGFDSIRRTPSSDPFFTLKSMSESVEGKRSPNQGIPSKPERPVPQDPRLFDDQ